MKNYTDEQKDDARRALSPAARNFLGSQELMKIYRGIEGKHDFALLGAVRLSVVVNATLLKLEPESALETNLHDTFPSMGNAELKELAEDVRDRVFSEAKRRESEEVLSPESTGNIELIVPDTPTDAELDQIVAQEEQEQHARADEILKIAADPALQKAAEAHMLTTKAVVEEPHVQEKIDSETRKEIERLTKNELVNFIKATAYKDVMIAELHKTGAGREEGSQSSAPVSLNALKSGGVILPQQQSRTETPEEIPKQSGIINRPKQPSEREGMDPKEPS